MTFCSSCGHQLEEGVVYCPSCGSRVLTEAPQLGGPTNLPPIPPKYPIYNDADKHALDKLKLFAIIFLIGALGGIVFTFVFVLGGIYSIPLNISQLNSTSTGTQAIIAPNFFSNLFYTIIATSLIGVIIEFVALLQLRSAFKGLTTADRSYFGIPSKLTIVELIALPLLIIGLLATLSVLGSFFTTMVQNQNQTTTLPAGIGIFFGATALEVVSGIAVVIGYIGGIMLGIWRMGSRYNETLFKVAAIFLIIPLLQIVAPILILIGTSGAKSRISIN